ncbi:hypothetical protein PTKIN_Ptkin04bG0038900 [Pterospermum kingtungense]
MIHCLYIYVLPFLLSVIFLIKWIATANNPQNLEPPSPPRLPVLGNLHQLGSCPHISLSSLAQRYGPIMMLRLGGMPVLVASSADGAREIMKTHDVIFSNRPIFAPTRKLLYHGKNLLTAPYGEYWRHMRSISVLHLLSNKRVQSFKAVREEEIALIIDKIKESSLMSVPVDLSEMLVNLTNDVICRVAFGRKYSGDDEGDTNFREALEEFFFFLGNFNIGNFIPWLAWINLVNGIHSKIDRVAKWFDKFLDKVIDEHIDDRNKSRTRGKRSGSSFENEDSNKDFVDVLLEIQKDNNIAGFSLGRDGIKGLILDMFAGGTDTTYTVLEWAMSELLRHPEAMKQMQNEVRRIGNGKSNITEDDLDKMHYLKAVIKETLRLYPPVPLLVRRLSSQDVQIKGYDIAAGTIVFTNAWAIGRDPATWDAPDEFQPERFLNTPIDVKGHDFEVIPFGAGRRGCPGYSFAMVMNEVVLANLVYKFDWSLPGGATGEDLDMTQSVGLVAHRKVHLKAVATPSFC